jgi:mannosyltransferase
MAIARPIRVLGLLAVGLWVFFLYQVWGPPKYPKGPGDTLENMERDPNLDRMQYSASPSQEEISN